MNLKNIVSIFLFVLPTFFYAQSNLNVALKYQVLGSPSISGNNYTINGVVSDDNGLWNAASVSVGDSIFYLDSGILYPLVVTTINSASGTVLNVTALSISPLVSGSGNGNLGGQIAISRKNNIGLCPVPSGLNAALSAAMENRNKQKTFFIGASGVNITGTTVKADTSLLATKTDTAQLNSKSLTLAQLAYSVKYTDTSALANGIRNSIPLSANSVKYTDTTALANGIRATLVGKANYITDTTGNYVKYRANLLTPTDSVNLRAYSTALYQNRASYLVDTVTMLAKKDTAKFANGIRASITAGGGTYTGTSGVIVSGSVIKADTSLLSTKTDTAQLNSKSLTLAQLALKTNLSDTSGFESKTLFNAQNAYNLKYSDTTNLLYVKLANKLNISDSVTIANGVRATTVNKATNISDTTGNYVKYRLNLLTPTDSISIRAYANALYQNKASYLADTVTMLAKKDTAKFATGIRASIPVATVITGTSPITVTSGVVALNKLDSNKLVVGGIQAAALSQHAIDTLIGFNKAAVVNALPYILTDGNFKTKTQVGNLVLAVNGDSNTEGTGRLYDGIVKAIQESTGQDMGGYGFAGAGSSPTFGFGVSVQVGAWTVTDVKASTSQRGLDGSMAKISTTGKYRFDPSAASGITGINKCDHFSIFTKNTGAVYSYQIDNGTAVNVTTLSDNSLNITTISGLTDAPHTIDINWVSGNLELYGGTFERSTGFKVHKIAKSGSTALDWSNLMRSDSANYIKALNFLGVKCFISNIGHNDAYFGRTAKDFIKSLDTLHTILLSGIPNVSEIYVGTHRGADTKTADIQGFNDSLCSYSLRNRIGYYNLNSLIPSYTQAVTDGYLWASDSVHYLPPLSKIIAYKLLQLSAPAAPPSKKITYLYNTAQNSSNTSATTLLPDNGGVELINPLGAFKISLPTLASGQEILLKLRIREQEYNIYGRPVAGGTWLNTFVQNTDTKIVRYGYDGTNLCVYVGELGVQYAGSYLVQILSCTTVRDSTPVTGGFAITVENSAFQNVTQSAFSTVKDSKLALAGYGNYNTVTGILQVKTNYSFATSADRTNVKLTLHVYQYSNDYEYKISVYVNEGGTPIYGSTVYMSNPNSPQIQLARTGNNLVVLIGTASTSWNGAQVRCDVNINNNDLNNGGDANSIYLANWATTLIGSTTGLTNITTPTNITPLYVPTLGATSINGSGSTTLGIGNSTSTENILGTVNLNSTGSGTTTIGNASSTTTINGASLIMPSLPVVTTINAVTDTLIKINGNTVSKIAMSDLRKKSYVELSGTGTTVANATQTVQGWTVTKDSLSNFSGSTFTAPASGIYNVNGVWGFSATTTTSGKLGIFCGGTCADGVAGRILGAGNFVTGITADYIGQTFGGSVFMNAGETLTIKVYQNTGASQTSATGLTQTVCTITQY